jgi:hypothetical protein
VLIMFQKMNWFQYSFISQSYNRHPNLPIFYFRAASGDANCLTDYMILHGGHCKVKK